ncbi:MAG: hypothetical protein ACFFAE_02485 [Candidatus Hodarchaeota archaeon]
MFGINIITKAGILVFSHSFAGNYLTEIDSDIDIQAGLISAVLNALRETRGETVTAIRYRGYMLLLYEGVLTYGILFTVEDDPKLHDFLKTIVLKFEIVFTDELYKETVLNRMDFETFRIIVRNQYAEMITIDVTNLDRLIKIMRHTTIANYIIYETKFFHPVFTKISESLITSNLPQITRIFRDISDLEKKIHQKQTTSEIKFAKIHFYEIKTPTHCVVLFYSPEQKDKTSFIREINQIKKKMIEQ